jgi:asparagine synthase (glutamine-hydrolysing)
MIRYVSLDERHEIQGDPTGRDLTYYYVDAKSRQIALSPDCNELLSAYLNAGHAPALDNESISFLLHHSFIPIGSSIFRDVRSLGAGDFLRTGRDGGIVSEEIFPYFSWNSSQVSTPSTRELLDKLTQAAARACKLERNNWLMLSSGKDSVSLALAYANAGLSDHLTCVTFDNGTDNEESVYAAKISKALGLRHERRSVPQDTSVVRNVLIEYFQAMPVPCVDHVQIAYLLSLAPHGRNTHGLLIDGMGSDIYIGHVPTRRMVRNDHWVAPRLRSIRRFFPLGSRVDALCRPRSELHFPAPMLRHADTRVFYDFSRDTHEILYMKERPLHDLDTFDLRQYVRGKHLDTGPGMQKARNVARYIGADCAFPWADPEVIEYCFNLPEPSRFSRHEFTNKILVRQMLREFCGYDERALPKRGFEFSGAAFVRRNWQFIEEEILECPLWNANMRASLRKLLSTMDRIEKLNYPILIIFMISGWHNHYYRALRAGAGGAPGA